MIPGKDPTPGGNWVCPSVKGATNWMGQSFNPGTGLLYVITLEQCGMFTQLSAVAVADEKLFRRRRDRRRRAGHFCARIDPKTGKRAWEYPMTGAGRMWSGTVSTAGGVVFVGDDDGHLLALDARTGKHLWHFNMGELLTASPVTYEVDGNSMSRLLPPRPSSLRAVRAD